jgi:hypothetical protein
VHQGRRVPRPGMTMRGLSTISGSRKTCFSSLSGVKYARQIAPIYEAQLHHALAVISELRNLLTSSAITSAMICCRLCFLHCFSASAPSPLLMLPKQPRPPGADASAHDLGGTCVVGQSQTSHVCREKYSAWFRLKVIQGYPGGAM